MVHNQQEDFNVSSRLHNYKSVSASVLVFWLGMILFSEGKPVRIPPPSPIFINLEPLESSERPPQIDALAFENRSSFVVQNSSFIFANPTFFLFGGSGMPLYQGQSVLFWTNSGTMVGAPGFRFETLPDVRRLTARQRRKAGANLASPSKAFVNEGDITVSAQLYVNATNLISSGSLEGDLGARITLLAPSGTVDLSQGTIRIGRTVSQFAPSPFFFFNLDSELTTLYAATGTNGVYNRTNGAHLVLPGGYPFPPSYEVLVNPTLSGLPVTTRFTNLLSSVSTCGSGFASFAQVTNIGGQKSVRVAFVDTNSLIETNLNVSVHFLDSNFGGQTIAVEYQSKEFDIIEQTLRTNVITFVDTGAISPMPPPTNRFSLFPSPSNYQIIRSRLAGFESGSPGNTEYTTALLYDQNFLTNDATYAYSAASFQLGSDNLSVFDTPVITPFLTGFGLGVLPAAADPTNFPSRVEIRAQNLNLANTRIRSEQVIDIQATNLVDNSFATLDAPFVSFDVGTTNVNLVISNLIPATVNRAQGQISAYSAIWSSQQTNELTGLLETVRYHILILGNCLRFSQPIILHRFTIQATNLVIEDNLFVNNTLKLNSEAVTIGSNASLQLPIRSSWAFTNVMNLSHFTNFGTLNVPGAGAYFGTVPTGYAFAKSKKKPKKKSPPQNLLEPYTDFINHGVIVAATASIDTRLFENTGSPLNPAILVATNGPILIGSGVVEINNALIVAGENVELRGSDVSLRNSIITAGSTNFAGGQRTLPGALIISATNSFTDNGDSNQIFVTSGIRLLRQPADLGDLLATTVNSRAGLFNESVHVWAGEDRGSVPEGFTNNLSLGRLILDGALLNKFRFRGITGSNALYVDYLEFRNDATNYNGTIQVDSDFTIYFGDSNVAPDKLAELGNGRIQWVSSFAGPQSSTRLTYPDGSSHTFNAGLVRSEDLDSDGDGFPNANDCTPIPVEGFDTTGQQCIVGRGLRSARAASTALEDLNLTISYAPGAKEVILNWNAPANSVSALEFSESLAGGTWESLTNFINGSANARVTVRDAAKSPQRVYRVRVDAGKP